MKLKKDDYNFGLHELVHGAYLTSEMLFNVGSGEVNELYAAIYKKHPELQEAYDAAEAAVQNFYHKTALIHMG